MPEREKILPVREEMAKHRGPLVRAIVIAERVVAHPAFFLALALAHVGWMIVNSGWIPGIPPWDPYPFTFLATIASVEAPLITLLVLMRQHRDRRVAEVRDELELAISLRTHRQAAMLLRLSERLRQDFQLPDPADPGQREKLDEDLDPEELLSETLRRLEIVEGKSPEEE